MLVHLDKAKVALNMSSYGIHERCFASTGFTMKQVAAVIRDSMLGIERPRFIFQKPLEVIQEWSLHASSRSRKIEYFRPESGSMLNTTTQSFF